MSTCNDIDFVTFSHVPLLFLSSASDFFSSSRSVILCFIYFIWFSDDVQSNHSNSVHLWQSPCLRVLYPSQVVCMFEASAEVSISHGCMGVWIQEFGQLNVVRDHAQSGERASTEKASFTSTINVMAFFTSIRQWVVVVPLSVGFGSCCHDAGTSPRAVRNAHLPHHLRLVLDYLARACFFFAPYLHC